MLLINFTSSLKFIKKIWVIFAPRTRNTLLKYRFPINIKFNVLKLILLKLMNTECCVVKVLATVAPLTESSGDF